MQQREMMIWVLVVASVTLGGGCAAPRRHASQDLRRVPPEALHWSTPPSMPDVQAAWVLSTEKGEGPYLLRVRLAAGARIAPHTHPDERQTTVLDGTVYIGSGGDLDEEQAVAMPAGTVYVIPAGRVHSVWAKDGPVLYQEAGVGPTSTHPE